METPKIKKIIKENCKNDLTSNTAKGGNAQYADTPTRDRCQIRIRLKQAPADKDKNQNNNISTSAERKKVQNRDTVRKFLEKMSVQELDEKHKEKQAKRRVWVKFLEASTPPQSDNEDYGPDILGSMVPIPSSSKKRSARKRVKHYRSMAY
ncbi:hypothetical protein ILUMI_25491 [Ignelater luminosus]|uniref:Uncharacterized protein n=1 Tax=Ignelater luminosus TaxID=2038154 RepID=A0A8K0C9X0_IGNLU|nr:hypothetical protein ILUMI_25491 [Ignelater luminosus]